MNDMAKETGSNGSVSRWLKPFAALVAVAILILLSFVLPVRDYLQQMLAALQALGGWGLVILAASYILACILFIPGSILTIGAGFLAAVLYADQPLLAVVIGTITVSAGSVSGASAAFLLGRTLARDWVAEKVQGNRRFRALDEALGRSGLKMVFLVRLSPAFPFNMLNYMMGLTNVRFRDYLLGSWIGMLPGTVLYVYIGTTAQSLTEVAAGGSETGGTARTALLIVGLIATFLVVALVTRLAKRALNEAV